MREREKREGEMSNHVNEEAGGNQLWHLEWLRVNPLSPRLQKDSRAGTGQGAVEGAGEGIGGGRVNC